MKTIKRLIVLMVFSVVISLLSPTAIHAQSASYGTVSANQKISDTQGSFTAAIDNLDYLGTAVEGIGDLNNDGVEDVVIGAPGDDGGGSGRGAIFVLFMNTDGTVNSFQKVNDITGSFGGTLDDDDFFGCSIANIGDLNNDGVTDLAVGAKYDDDGNTDRGAVWILFMNTDGTVDSYQKISDTAGSFTGTLDDSDLFGSSVGGIGDLNGDTVEDIIVGAPQDGDGGNWRGALWVLFMNTDGTVASYQKISDTQGNFGGTLTNLDRFGYSVNSIGDLNDNGVVDFAVGAYADADGGTHHGALWILFMNANGTVASSQKISDTQGNFTGTLVDYAHFGTSSDGLDDLDGDNIEDIIVGAEGIYNGEDIAGTAWVLFMNMNGTVKSHQEIALSTGGFTGTYDTDDYFASGVANIGDLDDDKVIDIFVGSRGDDDGGSTRTDDRGAGWVLFMNGYYTSVISNTPAGISAVRADDLTTDVEVTGQNGTQAIALIDDSSGQVIAIFNVDFAADRDWSFLLAGSQGELAFFHYPQGYTSLPGSVGESYTLYVVKGNSNGVGICPEAASFDDITDSCSGLYYLSDADSNVSIVELNGVVYWKIEGLTGSGSFAASVLPETGGHMYLYTTIGLVLFLFLFFIVYNKQIKKHY